MGDFGSGNATVLSRRGVLSGTMSLPLAAPIVGRQAAGHAGLASVGLWAASPAQAQGGPAAHAMRLGDTDVTILSDGALSLPASTLAANVGEGERTAFLEARGFDPVTRASPLNVTLLRRGDAVVLVDTGAGLNFFEQAGLLADSFAAAGLAREDVTHVVLTHAHPDHVWGIIDDFDETERFPNAAYLIGAAEWDYWMAPDFLATQPEALHSFALGAQRNLGAIADKVTRVGADHAVLPGVTMIATPGHTVGHMSVLVEDGGRQLLVTGDALTHPAVSFEHPDWQPTTDQIPDLAARTRRMLLDRAATDGLHLVGYHLPWPGVGRVEVAGSAWRFVQDA